MKNVWLSVTVAVALIGVATTVQAIPITGAVTFAGGALLNTASAGTATMVTGWNGGVGGPANPFTISSSGNLATAALTPVAFTAPMLFNNPGQLSLWSYVSSISGTTFTFNLIASSIFSQGAGTVSVVGTGTIVASGAGSAGLSATPGTWTFTTSDPGTGTGPTFSFQAATGAIPDGGTTVLLLGAALSGLSLIRRKLVA